MSVRVLSRNMPKRRWMETKLGRLVGRFLECFKPGTSSILVEYYRLHLKSVHIPELINTWQAGFFTTPDSPFLKKTVLVRIVRTIRTLSLENQEKLNFIFSTFFVFFLEPRRRAQGCDKHPHGDDELLCQVLEGVLPAATRRAAKRRRGRFRGKMICILSYRIF